MPILYELLRDDYSFEEAKSLQNKFQKLIKTREESKVDNFKSIKTIAGVDVSYYNKKKVEYGVACAILWDVDQGKIEISCFAQDKINFPYKPGFLGFRECKILAAAILKLPSPPELILCDGHGKIHPRRFGEAIHLGIALNIPTIGVAKKMFIGYSDWNRIEKFKGYKAPVWSRKPINKFKGFLNELLGYAVCLKDASNPVFVSEGYKVDIDTALNICLLTTKEHRQPEPLYLADYYSREKVKEIVQ
ncbi:MAG: endonuclease V [Candidatus Hermodarchaeota archaeon]